MISDYFLGHKILKYSERDYLHTLIVHVGKIDKICLLHQNVIFQV